MRTFKGTVAERAGHGPRHPQKPLFLEGRGGAVLAPLKGRPLKGRRGSETRDAGSRRRCPKREQSVELNVLPREVEGHVEGRYRRASCRCAYLDDGPDPSLLLCAQRFESSLARRSTKKSPRATSARGRPYPATVRVQRRPGRQYDPSRERWQDCRSCFGLGGREPRLRERSILRDDRQ